MEWIVVEGSSNIHSWAWEEGTPRGILRVRFWDRAHEGPAKQYRYDGVPAGVWELLLKSASKGTAFGLLIRNKYPTTEEELS